MSGQYAKAPFRCRPRRPLYTGTEIRPENAGNPQTGVAKHNRIALIRGLCRIIYEWPSEISHAFSSY